MLSEIIRALGTRGVRSPREWLLAEARRNALEEVVAEVQPRGTEIGARIAGGDARAREELAALADEALATMRERVGRQGPLGAVLAPVDRLWLAPDAIELMDRADLEAHRRTEILEALDRFNRTVGSYDLFLDELRPLLRDDGPTTILDLAAGHAGFAVHLLRAARDQGLDLRVTATDLCAEYLEVGRRHAAAEGLTLDVRVQDALDLTNLAPGEADIVICTQAQHHFPPGLVAVMFETAARAAARGVVFIDGSRSVVHAGTAAALGMTWLRSADFAHDAVLSLRRFFYPEELALLARVGAWGEGVTARWMPPNHCLLRLDTRGRAAA